MTKRNRILRQSPFMGLFPRTVSTSKHEQRKERCCSPLKLKHSSFSCEDSLSSTHRCRTSTVSLYSCFLLTVVALFALAFSPRNHNSSAYPHPHFNRSQPIYNRHNEVRQLHHRSPRHRHLQRSRQAHRTSCCTSMHLRDRPRRRD